MPRRCIARSISILLIAVFGAAGAACAGGPAPAPASTPASPPKPVFLTNRTMFTPRPARELGRTMDMHQLIEGRYQAMSFSYEAYVKADGGSITMVALSGFGTQVYELTYSEAGLSASAVPFAGRLSAEYLLADFQLCYYPLAALRPALESLGLELEETPEADGFRRELREGTEIIIAIRRRGGTIAYQNLLRGYGYTITEAPADAEETSAGDDGDAL